MKIIDIENKGWEVDCIGCAIATKTMIPPGGIIKETQDFELHQDPEIPIKGFLIISSKKHIKSITELTQAESCELFELVYTARKALLQVPDILECTIIQEERSSHFHIWLLPRYAWMNEQFTNSLSDIRAVMKYAKENMKTEKNILEICKTVDNVRRSF